ncbi:hypothetical protein V8C37DRAFT_413456 [Trichoderma ceciliae]
MQWQKAMLAILRCPISTTKYHFEIGSVILPDGIGAGLLSLEQADRYFTFFFQGCDHYVPSIRERSSVICTIGCRRMLNYNLARPAMASLETIHALLVRWCYASERYLLVAAATRMALDLSFPDSYDEMINRSAALATRGNCLTNYDEDTLILMRRVRIWLHLSVLGHILHVDAADLPTFKFVGDSRRSQIMFKIEFNVIRGRIYDSLSCHTGLDEKEMMDVVREARAHIFEKYNVQAPWFSVYLLVRASGVENVDFMSPAQKYVVAMAKDALEGHLDIMIEEPRLYIRNPRFAIDFVWAKCAFCYLLLLKLSILLLGSKGRSSRELVAHGNILLTKLGEASVQYLQLLQSGIEKFSRVTYEAHDAALSVTNDGSFPSRRTPGFGTQTRMELDSFIPKQPTFEWYLPGLTLFSSSATGIAWLNDIFVDSLGGEEDVFGWLPTDTMV